VDCPDDGQLFLRLRPKREAFTIGCAIRPQRTQIERRDALRVIRSRDVPDAFFCLDPPYAGSDRGHYDGYSREDFDALPELPETARGKFLPSLFRSKSLAEFSKRNGRETVEYSLPLTMTHGAKIVKRKVEVLTANYPIREKAPASGRKAM
jgi:DNA adenine methylase